MMSAPNNIRLTSKRRTESSCSSARQERSGISSVSIFCEIMTSTKCGLLIQLVMPDLPILQFCVAYCHSASLDSCRKVKKSVNKEFCRIPGRV